MDFSFSRVAWKDCEEAFSWLARLRREVVRSSCSRREALSADSLVGRVGLRLVLVLVAVAGCEGVGVGFVVVGLRLRRVGGCVVVICDGGDVDVEVVVVVTADEGGIVVGVAAAPAVFDSPITGVSAVFPTIGLANKSFHSSSTSLSSASSSSPRASSSSSTLCMRLSSCLSRTISACASCRRSSGLICGSERSNCERRVRA